MSKVYLFNSDKLYYQKPANPSFRYRPVVDGTLKCHNVVKVGGNFVGGTTYDFQLVDDKEGHWYRTQYDWALVLDTPENVAALARVNNLYHERDQLMRIIRDASSKVRNIRTELQLEMERHGEPE